MFPTKEVNAASWLMSSIIRIEVWGTNRQVVTELSRACVDNLNIFCVRFIKSFTRFFELKHYVGRVESYNGKYLEI